MSGLSALFHRDGRPVDEMNVWAMLAAAPYRGPDGAHTQRFDAVVLGHARMAMTSAEVQEQQPLVSARTGCAIIADVRLDNREDLLARLSNRPLPTASDAALILMAYEDWGIDAPAHLLGDFAFVIWDPRHQRLVCARDTSGQRMLFYRLDHRTFAAASEIHQLLQDPAVPVEPNEERIRDYLVPLNVFQNEKDRAATFFEGIYAVPAGHCMIVHRRTQRQWQYWQLNVLEELRYRHDEEYAEHYRALFFEVVRARLRSFHPIGVMLSGGLDSSSVACTAQELFRGGRAKDPGFTSFSLAYDGLECDERPLIRDIQEKYGFAAQFISCGELGGRLQLEPAGFMEAPNMGIKEPRDALFSAVDRAGVRALLTGDTADACVGGSELVFDSLLRRGRLRALWRRFSTYRRVSSESLRKSVVLYCLGPLLPLGLQKRLETAYTQRVIRRHWRRLLPSWLPEPLGDDLAQRHLRLCVASERGRRFSNPSREEEYRLLYPPQVARHPVPWALEIWRPFADRRLHEFLLAIPPEQKYAPHPDTDEFYAGSKRLVRRAMRGIIPESIRTLTTKVHFRDACENEVQRQWPLYEAAFGPSARPEISLRGYVDQDKFWSRLQEMRSGVHRADLLYVMECVGLETWLRTFALPRPRLTTVPPPWGTRLAVGGTHAGMTMPSGSTRSAGV